MAQLDINMTSFDVFWTNVLQGFGFGLAFTPMIGAGLRHAAAAAHHRGTGVFHLVRNFGSSLFISASVVLLLRSTAGNYATMTEFLTPFNKTLAYPGGHGTVDHGHAQWSDGAVGRGAAAGGDDRLHQRVLSFFLHRRGCGAVGVADA